MQDTFSSPPEFDNTCTLIEPVPQEAPIRQRVAFGDTQGTLLLNEISHRFKNELASIIGIVSAASMRSKDLEARRILDEVEERLHDHATICCALQMPSDSSVSDASSYLRNLLAAIGRAKLERRRIQVIFREFQRIQCSAVQCWTLGMIVSELVTNSLRHAFECGGTIAVELIEEDDWIVCRVSDNGSGALPAREGGGLKIVQSLARGLGGAINQHFGPRGTSSVATFPRATMIKR